MGVLQRRMFSAKNFIKRKVSENSMLLYYHQDVELHLSPDISSDFNITTPERLEERVKHNLRVFMEHNPKYKEYIHRFSPLKGVIILDAHGDEKEGKFVYWDGDKSYSVQSWINRNDGRAAALILSCCNPASLEIRSKKSIVLVPDQTFSGERLNNGKVTIEMYVPKVGYVDSYIIDYELGKLPFIV